MFLLFLSRTRKDTGRRHPVHWKKKAFFIRKEKQNKKKRKQGKEERGQTGTPA